MKNPLAGLVVCGRCGRVLRLRPNPAWPMLRCCNRQCRCPGSRFDLVEKRLLDGLSGWLDDYRVNWEKSKKGSKISRSFSIQAEI